ncbi:MAG: disulfide bond formation protein B [Woeseiaceae bacterium]|nr:disulfide bond formation protein B [Woeseiaceae bacterium]
MPLPSKRIVNLAGLLACAGMMGFALYAQYVLLLDPCPLCVLQRVAVIALGLVFLAGALHVARGRGRWLHALLILVTAGSGAAVAAWHVRLQNLPADQVPACGPGLGYMLDTFPLTDALAMVFRGSGECADVVWRLLGLSMPSWVLIGLTGLGAAGIWNSLRSAEH